MKSPEFIEEQAQPAGYYHQEANIELERLDPYQLLLLGARYEHLALTSQTTEEASYLFNRSNEAFQRARSITGSDSSVGVAAAHLLANYSLELGAIVQPLVVQRQMPSIDTVNKVHRTLVNSLYRESSNDRRQSMTQAYDVFAVLSLLHYWQVNVYKDTDWLALLSFVGQPLTTIKDLTQDGHISIYTNYGSINRIYSLQVNKPNSSESASDYQSETKVVNIDELKLDYEESVSAQRIITELYEKQHAKCIKRSNLLVDLLG